MKTATFSDLKQAITNDKAAMPARVGDTLHVYLTKLSYVSISPYPPTEEEGDIPLFSARVEFDVPENARQDMTEKRITSLERQKSMVLATAHQQVRRLEGEIQNLRALEHKPEAAQ